MKIRKKSTGKVLNVSEYAWKRMRHDGTAKRYEVVQPVAKTVELKAMEEEEKGEEGLDGWDCTTDVQEPSREQMIETLKEKGIIVPHNIGDETLKQRYDETN